MHERIASPHRLATAVALLWLAAACSRPPTLEGRIQQVRVYEGGEPAPGDAPSSVVVVDFRVTNPSRYPFLVKNAILEIETAAAGVVTGSVAADRDAARYLELNPAQGPKYNPSLVVRERIAAGQTIDRMLAATFPLPAAEVRSRKAIRIRILDADGPVAVITP